MTKEKKSKKSVKKTQKTKKILQATGALAALSIASGLLYKKLKDNGTLAKIKSSLTQATAQETLPVLQTPQVQMVQTPVERPRYFMSSLQHPMQQTPMQQTPMQQNPVNTLDIEKHVRFEI